MKKLHKVLGTHQDSVVTCRALLALESEDTDNERHAFVYGILYDRQQRNADVALKRLPELRRRAGRRKLTRLP